MIVLTLTFLAGFGVLAWRVLPPPRKERVRTLLQAGMQRVEDMESRLRDRLLRRRMAWRRAFLSESGALHPDGEAMLAHLAQFCYLATTTAAGKASPEEILRREGRRQVAIEILAMISSDPVEAVSVAQRQQVLA